MTDESGGAPPPLPPPFPSSGPPPLPPEAGPPPAPQQQQQQPEPPPLRASLQSTEQTRTYPCHQCGAQLVFDPAKQLLACPSCGNTQPIIEAAGRHVVEHDYHPTSAATQVAGPRAAVAEKEIVCQSCGGHTTFSGSLTATRCPYCATPIQRDDVHDAPDRIPVDAVLPFQVAEKVAHESVEGWINSRRFAPSEFKKYKETGALTSIYVAYFTFDATAITDYVGERGDHYTVEVGSGDDRHTETRTDWNRVSGRVVDTFDDLPILANNGLDTGKVTALEPWPTEQAKPFSAEYVAGHLCRTYDNSVDDCLGTAKQVMQHTIDTSIRYDIGGDEQRINQQRTDWQDVRFKHLLLPIWLLTVVYAGRPFQVCINGVTGEVQGHRPFSKVKIAAAITLAVIIVIIVAVLYARSK